MTVLDLTFAALVLLVGTAGLAVLPWRSRQRADVADAGARLRAALARPWGRP